MQIRDEFVGKWSSLVCFKDKQQISLNVNSFTLETIATDDDVSSRILNVRSVEIEFTLEKKKQLEQAE